MRERITNIDRSLECRVKTCTMEDWIIDLVGYDSYVNTKIDTFICEECPLQAYANALASYEDKDIEVM